MGIICHLFIILVELNILILGSNILYSYKKSVKGMSMKKNQGNVIRISKIDQIGDMVYKRLQMKDEIASGI